MRPGERKGTAMRPALLLGVAIALGLAGATAAAPRREHVIDKFQVNPDLGAIRVSAVAMLPAVSYDGVLPAEKSAELEWMLKVKDTGYRWVSAPTSRDRLREAAGNDSILVANKQDLLAHERIDSLRAPGLCRLLRVNGLLSIRLDRAEKLAIQSDQSGRPATTVQVHAALVDSTGRLVWSASGAQVTEGPELSAASAGAGGGGFNGLGPAPITERNNAPEWSAAFQPMFLRWAPTFPLRAQLAGGANAPTPAAAPARAPADSSGR